MQSGIDVQCLGWPHVDVTYIVAAFGTGMVKVGRAAELRNRLRSLAYGNAVPLVLLAAAPGVGLERVLHHVFRPDRKHGEWFVATDRLLSVAMSWRRNFYTSMPLPTKGARRYRWHEVEHRRWQLAIEKARGGVQKETDHVH